MSRRATLPWTTATVIGAIAATAFACSSLELPFGWTINFPGFSGDPIPSQEISERLHVPPGFTIGEYATGIENARFMRFTSAGDLLVSSPRQGKVFLLARDRDHPGYAGQRRVLLEGLNQPHGMVLHDGWLYVAETDAVLRVRFDAESGTVSGTPERIVNGLPGGGNHFTRTLGVGPDGHLYVSIGSSCNVCVEKDRRRAAIVRYNLDGTGEEIWATGLRNSVGFAWQPGTGDLYATDNGRDLLGDDFPPDELNRIVKGGFYGWPIANGNRVPDPDYGDGHEPAIAASIPPAHAFSAHTASLGITFYDYSGPGVFPERYRGAAFVAQHGSWNRSKKIGYDVVALFFHPDGRIDEEPFATGFMVDEKVSGRPVDVAVGPDGALYVSDDFTGSIYRIAYGESERAARPGAAGSPAAPAASPGNPLAGIDPAERSRAIAHGQKLWDEYDCAGCHGGSQAEPAASAQQPAGGAAPTPKVIRRLADLTRKYDLASLTSYLRTPQPPMPAFPLTDDERRDLAIFLFDRHP